MSVIRNALREYSVKYFISEIFDEMHGYVEHDILKRFFRAVGAIRRRDFKIGDIVANLDTDAEAREKLSIILHALFECSAIGNIINIKERHHYLVFRYRNRHAAFRQDEVIILHRGLWRAFNLPLHKLGDDIEEYHHLPDLDAGAPY